MDLFPEQLDHLCQPQGSFSASVSFTIENKTINIIHTSLLCMHRKQQSWVSTPTLNPVIPVLQ